MIRSLFSGPVHAAAAALVRRDVVHLVTAIQSEAAHAPLLLRPGGPLSDRRPRPVDPLHALAAARLMRDQAETLMRGFVTEARSHGVPWFTIAPELGACGTDYDQLVAAFDWAATDGAYFHFKCLCGGNIRDTGPENGRPTNAESGHRDGCESLAAHMASYAAWQEDEASMDDERSEA